MQYARCVSSGSQYKIPGEGSERRIYIAKDWPIRGRPALFARHTDMLNYLWSIFPVSFVRHTDDIYLSTRIFPSSLLEIYVRPCQVSRQRHPPIHVYQLSAHSLLHWSLATASASKGA